MAWVAIGSAVVGAGASIYSANKNAKSAAAAKGTPLDINKLITDARTAAADNYKNSIALEQQYNPAQAALRSYSNLALRDGLSGNTSAMRARDSLLSGLGEENKLLAESADSILQSLRLGSKLSAETQNAVTRAALQTGGQAGLSGSFAGRGLVARDLGLTSLALEQQRQQQALQAGQLLSAESLGRFNALSNASIADANRIGLLSDIIDARALPESGLSPGSIADVTTGQSNAQNQSNAAYQASLAGNRNATLNSLLGFGAQALTAYQNRTPTKTTPSAGGYVGFEGV